MSKATRVREAYRAATRRFRFQLPRPCVAVGLAIAGLGCAKNTELSSVERAQFGRLFRAIDELRAAPNLQKEPLLGALRQAPCGPERGCSLKSSCVKAYEMFGRSLSETRAVRLALNTKGGKEAPTAPPAGNTTPPPNASELIERLLKAEATLRESQTLIRRCEQAQGQLRLQYHL